MPQLIPATFILFIIPPENPISLKMEENEGDGAKGGEDDVLDPFVGGSVLAICNEETCVDTV